MGTRHVMLEAALQDLGHVPGEQLGAAPAAALESACRSLAAVVGGGCELSARSTHGFIHHCVVERRLSGFKTS